jgi:uncharacterized protein YegL
MIRVALLLDESGSMGHVRSDVIGGYNNYIQTLKKDKSECTVSLFTFDATGGREFCRTIFLDKPLTKVVPLEDKLYQPAGGTPLNDAVLTTIKRMKDVSKKDDKVLVAIYTDGHENSSTASTDEVRQAILKREAKGWDFLYLGAIADAWDTAQAYGLAKAGQAFSTRNSGVGSRSSMGTLGQITNSYRDNDGDMTKTAKGFEHTKEIGDEELKEKK